MEVGVVIRYKIGVSESTKIDSPGQMKSALRNPDSKFILPILQSCKF